MKRTSFLILFICIITSLSFGQTTKRDCKVGYDKETKNIQKKWDETISKLKVILLNNNTKTIKLEVRNDTLQIAQKNTSYVSGYQIAKVHLNKIVQATLSNQTVTIYTNRKDITVYRDKKLQSSQIEINTKYTAREKNELLETLNCVISLNEIKAQQE